MMSLVRLQKFLSNAGFCSRRKGEEYIKKGLVKVNDHVVSTQGMKVDPLKDTIEVNGVKITAEQQMIYIALNKPIGYVTSCEQKGEKVVVDLIDIPHRIYPIGRLDKETSGLLLLTNNGSLHHHLSHPSFDHEKEYVVTTKKPITDSALKRLKQGVAIQGKITRPAKTTRISSKRFKIILKEGRNRQIRRMVGKVGNLVIKLKRIRISNIKLEGLTKGSWRYLTKGEKKELLGLLKQKS